MRQIETPLGPVVFHGRDTGRPVMLVITSAFARAEQLQGTQGRLPGYDVWRAHLPGNHCPPLATTSLEAFGAAFSHALGVALGDREALVLGNSAGALVALAMDLSQVRRLLLIEPPLHPTLVWHFRDLFEAAPVGGHDFVRSFFGVDATGHEPRDYRGLLTRLDRPALVLVGDEPLLPQRRYDRSPSVVDEESRGLLTRHPRVDLRVVPAGHNIIHDNLDAYVAALAEVSA